MDGDRWAPDGPPEEAYSRVTRDLAEVSAGFAAYLDALPGRLTETWAARVRAVSQEERLRLRGPGAAVVPGEDTEEYAVAPADPDAATLLLARSRFQGGAQLVLAFGRTVRVQVPDCWCDACDATSTGMVEEVERYLATATGGFEEYRRPHVARAGDELHRGPWLQEGFVSAAGSEGHASPDVRGDLFEHTWRAWPRR